MVLLGRHTSETGSELAITYGDFGNLVFYGWFTVSLGSV